MNGTRRLETEREAETSGVSLPAAARCGAAGGCAQRGAVCGNFRTHACLREVFSLGAGESRARGAPECAWIQPEDSDPRSTRRASEETRAPVVLVKVVLHLVIYNNLTPWVCWRF